MGSINWGLLAAGLSALAVVTIIGILIAAGNAQTSNGVWLVALLPIAAPIAGAIALAGHDSEPS